MGKKYLKSAAQALFKLIGFDVRRSHKFSAKNSSILHETIYTNATYQPWRADLKFMAAYRKIRSYSLVDQYRCFELWNLATQLAHMEGDVLEVGVWRGGTGVLLATAGIAASDTGKYYLADTFQGVVKADSQYDPTYKGGEHADTSQEIVLQLVSSMGVGKQVELLVGMFPEETGAKIQSRVIKLCHIDVDVYLSAKHCVEWVRSRMPIGGVIIFDDYGFMGCEGVTKLVDSYSTDPDFRSIYNLNGHAILIKVR